MKLSKILIAAFVGIFAAGCYNDFDMPVDIAEDTPIVYTDAYMESVLKLEHKTIAEIKAMFGEISNTGYTTVNANHSVSETMYKRFVKSENECTEFEKTTDRYIVGNYYIKGKVVSNDEQGNVYKSLYIYDGTEAIEIKLTNGLYIDYPCEVKDGGKTLWVYVKLDGLYMGNYRMMLSIGDIPTEGINSVGASKFYPNSNIVSPEKVHKHVFKGKEDTLTEGRLSNDGSNYTEFDILDIDNDNYSILRNPKYFGRTMRFNNVEVMYQGVKDQDGNTPAMYDAGNVDPTPYPSWICTSGTIKAEGYYREAYTTGEWGKLAYSQNNVALYGQLLVGYNKNSNNTNNAGVYVVRTSGYARYANRLVPRNGATGSILGIYSIYAQKSTYNGANGDYATYQLTPFRFEDLLPEYYGNMTTADEKEMEQWAARVSEGGNIPDESYDLPLTQDEDYED